LFILEGLLHSAEAALHVEIQGIHTAVVFATAIGYRVVPELVIQIVPGTFAATARVLKNTNYIN